ncbi:MAG: hypothetical protein GXW99_01780 [Clostridiales bacterium]|nr:hypothetical protein [Clostridiales bacterium]
MDSSRITVITWLMENGYPQIAEMINEIQAEWKISGKHTRRNWWDVLSGGKNGSSRIIYGRQFPVLQAAQVRQGKPVTKNALKITQSETDAPAAFDNGRWKKASVSTDITPEEEVAIK